MKTKIQSGDTDNLIDILDNLNYKIIYNTGATIYGVYQKNVNFIQVAICLDIELIDVHIEHNGNKIDKYITIPVNMTKYDLMILLDQLKLNLEN